MVSDFTLMGITYPPELQSPLFGLFLIIYISTMVGNVDIIFLTKVGSRLQTLMYFFLRHLAATDLRYSTAKGSKMFVNFGIKNLFLFRVTQLAFFFCSLVVNF